MQKANSHTHTFTHGSGPTRAVANCATGSYVTRSNQIFVSPLFPGLSRDGTHGGKTTGQLEVSISSPLWVRQDSLSMTDCIGHRLQSSVYGNEPTCKHIGHSVRHACPHRVSGPRSHKFRIVSNHFIYCTLQADQQAASARSQAA